MRPRDVSGRIVFRMSGKFKPRAVES